MRIENHIHIRHIMLYHFEKGWNAAQSFRDQETCKNEKNTEKKKSIRWNNFDFVIDNRTDVKNRNSTRVSNISYTNVKWNIREEQEICERNQRLISSQHFSSFFFFLSLRQNFARFQAKLFSASEFSTTRHDNWEGGRKREREKEKFNAWIDHCCRNIFAHEIALLSIHGCTTCSTSCQRVWILSYSFQLMKQQITKDGTSLSIFHHFGAPDQMRPLCIDLLATTELGHDFSLDRARHTINYREEHDRTENCRFSILYLLKLSFWVNTRLNELLLVESTRLNLNCYYMNEKSLVEGRINKLQLHRANCVI